MSTIPRSSHVSSASHAEVDGLACDPQQPRAKHLQPSRELAAFCGPEKATAPALTALRVSGRLDADRVEVGRAFSRALRQSGVSTDEIARAFDVAPSLVKRIRRGEVSLALWHWLRLPDAVRVATELELATATKIITR